MIPLTLNNINWLLCEVPEGSYTPESIKDYLLSNVTLQVGSYSLPFPVCSKMTEEQWREVVRALDQIVVTFYEDYENKGKVWYNATQSGQSLLRLHGYKEAILIRVEK